MAAFGKDIQKRLAEDPPEGHVRHPFSARGFEHYLSIGGVKMGMNDAFGYGEWDYRIDSVDAIKGDNGAITAYEAWVTLRAYGEGAEGARVVIWSQTETSIDLVKGANDLKRARGTAIADAVKRAALSLGPRLGLEVGASHCKTCGKTDDSLEQADARERESEERVNRRQRRAAPKAPPKASAPAVPPKPANGLGVGQAIVDAFANADPNAPMSQFDAASGGQLTDSKGMPVTAGGGAPHPDLPRAPVNGGGKFPAEYEADFKSFTEWVKDRKRTMMDVGEALEDGNANDKAGLFRYCRVNKTTLPKVTARVHEVWQQGLEPVTQADAAAELNG